MVLLVDVVIMNLTEIRPRRAIQTPERLLGFWMLIQGQMVRLLGGWAEFSVQQVRHEQNGSRVQFNDFVPPFNQP